LLSSSCLPTRLSCSRAAATRRRCFARSCECQQLHPVLQAAAGVVCTIAIAS
jgi:hypothetical protein